MFKIYWEIRGKFLMGESIFSKPEISWLTKYELRQRSFHEHFQNHSARKIFIASLFKFSSSRKPLKLIKMRMKHSEALDEYRDILA